MKICAVIGEFNPLHNGHKYLLEQARKNSDCDAVVCIMSGNFVQRGEPAIIDKSLRTESALRNGADAVIELPVLYSTANAECFAFGGVNIIKQLNNVTHMAFGCENSDANIIKKLAEIRLNESDYFKSTLKKFLDEGKSYPVAHSQATVSVAEKHGIDSVMSDKILKKPNNLLAIEYCKQLLKQNCAIKTVAIQRIGAEHNDTRLQSGYSSASSIREKVLSGEINEIGKSLPPDCFNALIEENKSNRLPNMQLFNNLILYSLRTKKLGNLFDAGEGIEIKLRQNALKSDSLDEAINLTKSKRYTRARINRLCVQALLEINKSSLFSAPNIPVRLLGIRKELKNEIGNICGSFIIKNSDLVGISETDKEYLRTEENAAAVYSLITNSKNKMYSSKLVEI